MSTLSADSLLSLWETGANLTPLRRCLLLLNAAWPEKSYEQWAQTGIGQRDDALLTLRESLFGVHLEATAQCPVCRESLELAFETGQIRVQSEAESQKCQVEAENYVVTFRLPTSADLIAVMELESPVLSPKALLLQRCILSAQHCDQAIDAQQLPPDLIQRIQNDMARLDPQAETLIALSCPQCHHDWQLNFDIAAYLWDEIGDWAQRILREVHTLARAYGWSERDILEMNAQRRRSYLELLWA
ncbi:MAG: hypothetical protein PHO08_08365 [Methylococcales bacterium]|nr:hypothetical protein [Methylococcales bacterium]